MKVVLMTKPQQQSALVLGLGLTGLSCVRFLLAQGYYVTVADTRTHPPELPALQREFPKVPVYTGAFDTRWLTHTDLLVASPGIPLADPMIAAAIAQGKSPVGDIELFARSVTAPVLAVTGSNGKSTVSALLAAMCHAHGMDVQLGGNIGIPALPLLLQPPAELYVLELSSFQLETTTSLNAQAATVLNVTPDHMDRYRDVDDYTQAKARVFHGDGVMVLNRDDALVMAMTQADRRVLSFGLGQPTNGREYGIHCRDGDEWLCRGDEPLLLCREVPLTGRHNLANVLAAMALASTARVGLPAMCQAIKEFKGLTHRCEWIGEHRGVLWINDSKATNVGATVAALKGMDRPVVLIAGGEGKDADFSVLRQAVTLHVRAVILIGRDAALIEAALDGVVPTRYASDMPEAVRLAGSLARSGDAVLLSPACASFDMFRNFEHRGEEFTKAVREMWS